MPEECSVVSQVAPPESLRVLQEPVKPLQPRELDPLRTVANAPCMEIKCGPHAEHERGSEYRQTASHEYLLFRTAEANPDDLRFEIADRSHEFLLFYGRKLMKRRRRGPKNPHPGEASSEPLPKLLGHTFDSAIQKMRNTREL